MAIKIINSSLRLLCLLVFITSCKSKKEDPKKNQKAPPPVVDVIIASPHAITNTIDVNGTVVASEFVELHPEISGRLTYLNVAEGKYIAKGTIVARVNDADLRAQMGKLNAQLNLAKVTQERYKKLLDISGINRTDYDVAVNQVYSLQADIGVLQAQIDRSILRAPFSGVIGLRQVSPGAYVTPQSILATMQKIDAVKIDFTVPEEYANIIHRGNFVIVHVDAASQQALRAKVVAIEPQANASTRNMVVRAVLQNGIANPGSFVRVTLNAGADKNSVMVPTSAIIPEDISKSLVVVKGGKAMFVKVETGVTQATLIEVTSGINPGDSIVVSGVLFARPNAPVRVRSVKQLEDLSKN